MAKRTNYELCMFKQSHDAKFASGSSMKTGEKRKSKEAPETLFDDDALEFPARTTRLFFHLT